MTKQDVRTIVEAEYPQLKPLHDYHISASLGNGRLLSHRITAHSIADAIGLFMHGDDISEDFSRSVSFTIVKYPAK